MSLVKCPCPFGVYPTDGSLGQQETVQKTGSQSVQPFFTQPIRVPNSQTDPHAWIVISQQQAAYKMRAMRPKIKQII